MPSVFSIASARITPAGQEAYLFSALMYFMYIYLVSIYTNEMLFSYICICKYVVNRVARKKSYCRLPVTLVKYCVNEI